MARFPRHPVVRTPEQILLKHATAIRYYRAQVLTQQQELEQNRTQHRAVVRDFDASRGLYRVQKADGSIVHARSISSSGSKGIGDAVSLYYPAMGEPVIRWL